MHNIPIACSDEAAQPKGPSPVRTHPADALGANPGALQAADEVILPRQHVRAFDVKLMVIVGPGCRGEQVLGAARAETLDDPQHTERHGHRRYCPH